nr:hypothetical protein CFP56_13164 [Quercus suber]
MAETNEQVTSLAYNGEWVGSLASKLSLGLIMGEHVFLGLTTACVRCVVVRILVLRSTLKMSTLVGPLRRSCNSLRYWMRRGGASNDRLTSRKDLAAKERSLREERWQGEVQCSLYSTSRPRAAAWRMKVDKNDRYQDDPFRLPDRSASLAQMTSGMVCMLHACLSNVALKIVCGWHGIDGKILLMVARLLQDDNGLGKHPQWWSGDSRCNDPHLTHKSTFQQSERQNSAAIMELARIASADDTCTMPIVHAAR